MTEAATEAVLLALTADIAAAHVSNNTVPVGEIGGLIARVYDSLAGLGAAAKPEVEKVKPAVSARASVKPDAITCMTCGTKLKMLKRHLGTDHGQTPAEYRAQWNLPADYPMVAPAYATQRRDLAVKIGLGRKPKGGSTPTPKPRRKLSAKV